MESNGWTRHEEYVLQELKRLSLAVESLRTEFNTFRLEMVDNRAEHRGKATVYGVVAGFVSSVITYFVGHKLGNGF